MVVMVESFLTDKQKRVLELREKGHTQEEISEIVGTSRSNISLIEKRARENIIKSEETIREYKRIISPICVEVDEGVDVLDVPKKIYEEANEGGVKVDLATVEIIEEIERYEEEVLDNRVTKKPFKVYVSEDGDVLIEEYDSI